MDAHDVKRACVRGAVVGAANALALVAASIWFPAPASVAAPPGSVVVLVGLDVSPGLAALFGLLTGLLATPIALVELHRARRPRALGGDVATAAAIFGLTAVLVALASLQAIYTREVLASHSAATAARSVAAAATNDDAPGYLLLCLAAAFPVTVVSTARILRLPLWAQVLAALVVTTVTAAPVLAFIAVVPDVTIPTDAMSAWLFGTAVTLPLLSVLADRIVGGREQDQVKP